MQLTTAAEMFLATTSIGCLIFSRSKSIQSTHVNQISLWAISAALGIAAISIFSTQHSGARLSPPASVPSANSSIPPLVSSAPLASPAMSVSESGTIYSHGTATIRGTWNFDLDNGVEVIDLKNADFWWEQKTISERSIVPTSGSEMAVIGTQDFDSITLSMLKRLVYSNAAICADDNHANNIPTGTVVAYRTRLGKYGKFLVNSYGYNINISWITYNI